MAWLPQTKCYIWGSADRLWNDADWKWSECAIVREIMLGVDASKMLPSWLENEGKDREDLREQPDWPREEPDPEPASWKRSTEDAKKRKQFIELLCEVERRKFGKTLRKRDDIKISIKDVQLVLKEVAGVELIVEKEEVNYGILPIHRQK